MTFKTQIDLEIDRLFEKEWERVDKLYQNPHSMAVLSALEGITARGGKRLRGSFVYMMYQMFGGKDLEIAMKAAMIIEIIHAYLLLEDDFMDLSDTRRGGPTGHKMLESYHEENLPKGDRIHFGASEAVLASLMGSHMAMEMLNALPLDPAIIVRANLNLNQRLNVTVHGQICDVANEFMDVNDLSESDVFDVLHWKTAAYTYENPMHMGAILAGASDDDLELLSRYAIPAGIAFQIQDDILGVFGNDEYTGKSAIDDLREGKYTLLISHVLTHASESEKEEVLSAWGNRDLTEDGLERVKEIMTNVGSLTYSKEQALKYVEKAKAELFEIKQEGWNQEAFDYLLGVADYMIEREL